ncbi:hypothetical protein EDC04DRAFT_2604427 [Pisolithus marmoratus]|nr:hypothetical protein EDC04DRAFT_2604427 [Pisolithus marmoratus]
MLSWQLSGFRKMDRKDMSIGRSCRIMDTLRTYLFRSHNTTNTSRSRHTRSMTTEELLTKIAKVMDVVEKDMKMRHSNNISTFATSQAYITKCVICQRGMEQPFTYGSTPYLRSKSVGGRQFPFA